MMPYSTVCCTEIHGEYTSEDVDTLCDEAMSLCYTYCSCKTPAGKEILSTQLAEGTMLETLC